MATSLVCESVTGDSMRELLAARDAATSGDMVELRLDGVADIDVAAALHGRSRPVVVTCRAAWEGGRFDGSEEERCTIVSRALERGAEFVDIEWRALGASGQSAGGSGQSNLFDAVIRRDPARVVLSSHDFSGVPHGLDEQVYAMRATGAGVVKIAVTPSRLADTLPLIRIGHGGGAVVVGMGEAGVPTRLLATRYLSRWTYAGDGVAPGQIPARRMMDEFRFRSVGAHTRLFGLVSRNAMHSVSPAMHNAAFAAAGIDAVYVPLKAADFDDFLGFAYAMGIEGASITIPFKHDALRAAKRPDELSRAVGAANTLRVRAGAWEATNTDVAGFLDPLQAMFPDTLRGARAAVLGAGGSARAVAAALMSRGVRVTVHARREEQARELTKSLGADTGPWPPRDSSWDLLVNCTPLGGAGTRHESPLPGGPFGGRLVYDLTYGPGESALVREARRAGCLAIDGLPMLIAQAERQFEWWTGKRPAPGVMREAAVRRLQNETGLTGQATEARRR